MPQTQAGITSPPPVPGQPYDSSDDGPCAGWDKINGQPHQIDDVAGADSGPWKQT